ncbi:MAG: baeRF10 domain-containing protein [Anaerolineae bacterium]
MIGDKDVLELVNYAGPEPMLSVYLDTDLSDKPKDAVRLAFRQSLKSLDQSLSESDVEAVNHFLDYEYAWHSRGVAIFAAAGRVWKTLTLPVAVPSQAYWAVHPFIRPLVDFHDRYGNYNVALIDRESVRLFSVSGRKISSETEAFGEELKHHKQGGWAAARYQRHEDNIAHQNLKQAVELVESFCQKTGYQHLLLAGKEEILRMVEDMLPGALRKMLIAEFVADMRIAPIDILTTTLEILARSDQAQETGLVTDTITAAFKGGTGVRGLSDALYTLREGRMRQLLVSHDFKASGYICTHCGYIASDQFPVCPFCGERDIQVVPDAINEALVRALQNGVEVKIIRGNKELDEAGGIAATLRY